MDPVLIGYFPKRLVPPPPFLAEVGVTEVGSVSRCIAAGPAGWHELGKHNEWGCFDSPDAAWSLVPPADRSDFGLYAYEVYPIEFIDGAAQAREIAPLEVEPLDPSFSPVGWDAVSRSAGRDFECSALSCNAMVEWFAVNEYCLVSYPDANTLAMTAEREGCEPGPYLVVQVWRRDA